MRPYLIPKDFDMVQLCDSSGTPLFTNGNLALYVLDTNPSVPTNNGIGVLSDAISCTVTHQLNGEDELRMTYPITGQLFSSIEPRAVIVANVERTRGNQPYRIYRITKPISGIVTVYARHLAYDLAGIPVKPFEASDIQAALSGLRTHAMVYNPFRFSTTRTTGVTFRVKVPTSVWDLMGGQQGSLLDVYGGEYTFDGYNITLENSVGADNGVSVRYGVNMTDLEQDENIANCYTGVVAFWADDDSGEVVYSPVMSAGGTYGYVKIISVDMSDKWEEKPTVAQLKSAASTYITANKIGVPKVSWTIGFVPLDMTEEYKDIAILERVSIGDTVTVKFERLGVNATARVNKIVWDVLQDRYNSVSLGSIRSNIADTIVKQSREISSIPTKAEVQSLAKQISTTLTNAILGATGGSVRLLDTDGDGEPDTLYIADNPDPAQAVKVWRFNYMGWGASNNGYNGPFVLGATLDNGLLANFVTAANLTAGTIQSADGTTFRLNLDTGEMHIGGGYVNETDLSSAGGTTINGANIVTGTITASQLSTSVTNDISTANSTASSALSAANGANAQEQIIYISKASGTTSVAANTTWVTNSTGNQNVWTIKRPKYSSSYPVLFVATQRKTVEGNVTCTTPLVDDTTTVIDGGHITTGAIDAGRITTGTLTSSVIDTDTLHVKAANIDGSITVSQLSSDVQSDINTAKSDASSAATTANSALTKANGANKTEQLVYVSRPSGETSVNVPIAWVTNTSGNQNLWTLKRPKYNSNYPVLFVATQRKAVDGTVTCTTPVVDDTTTVIDGGHITTGAIDAGRITTGTMTADRINGGTLTVGGSNNANGVIVVKNGSGDVIGTLSKDALILTGSYSSSDVQGQIQDAAVQINCGTAPSYTNMVYLGLNSFTSASSAYGILKLGNASGTKITINGSTGRIDCKSLYINGTKVTP